MELIVCIVFGSVLLVVAVEISGILYRKSRNTVRAPESFSCRDGKAAPANASALPPVKFMYPPGSRGNPFDARAEGTFFIYASGLTLLSDDYNDFSDPYHNRALRDVIPIGYTTLCVYRRSMLVSDGRVIKRWEEPQAGAVRNRENQICRSGDDPFAGKYSLFRNVCADGNSRLWWDGGKIARPGTDSWQLGDFLWSDGDQIREFALRQSVANAGYLFLISRLAAWYDWH